MTTPTTTITTPTTTTTTSTTAAATEHATSASVRNGTRVPKRDVGALDQLVVVRGQVTCVVVQPCRPRPPRRRPSSGRLLRLPL
jgi:hypothetical protein